MFFFLFQVKIKEDAEEDRRTSKVMVPKTKTEADVQRAVKARRERQTRRATQGVTLESLKRGQQLYARVVKVFGSLMDFLFES